MPRATPYGEEARAERLARKPYDYPKDGDRAVRKLYDNIENGAEDEDDLSSDDVGDIDGNESSSSDSDIEVDEAEDDDDLSSDDENDIDGNESSSSDSDMEVDEAENSDEDEFPAMNELGEYLDEESYGFVDGNIGNPSGRHNNCAQLGFGYASGLPVTDIEDDFGRDEDVPTPMEEFEQYAEEHGYRIVDKLPKGYLEAGRRAALAYVRHDGTGHVVAVDGGIDESNYVYSDDQEIVYGRADEDDIANAQERYYLYRPDSEYLEEERNNAHDDDDDDDDEPEPRRRW